MEVVVTTGAVNRAKLLSNCHHQQINIQLFTDNIRWSYDISYDNSMSHYQLVIRGLMPFLLSNQQCQSTERKISYFDFVDLLTPSFPGVLQRCLWPLIAPSYLGRGLPCLSWALWYQYDPLHIISDSSNDTKLNICLTLPWICYWQNCHFSCEPSLADHFVASCIFTLIRHS